MSLKECCDIFNIQNTNNINKKLLKKNYHKLCLLYHPDKNPYSEEYFVKIQKCYEKLNNRIESERGLDSNLNDPDDLNEAYGIDLNKSIFNIDSINKLTGFISRYSNMWSHIFEIINLNVTLKQVMNKDSFIREDGHHIPLWHRIVCYFSVEKKKYFIFVIRISDLPANSRVSKDNDIYIEVSSESIQLNDTGIVHLCNDVTFEYYVNVDSFNNKRITIPNKGIPRIKKENIYNVSDLSTVYIFWI